MLDNPNWVYYTDRSISEELLRWGAVPGLRRLREGAVGESARAAAGEVAPEHRS